MMRTPRIGTLSEYRELAEHTLCNEGSHASFDRLRATAAELIACHDRVKTANESHDLLSEILQIARQKYGKKWHFKLDEFLQEEAGNVKALGERIKRMESSAEAGKTNSENADGMVGPWLTFFRNEKMKHKNWGPYRLAKYALEHRPWDADPDLVERSKTQLRRYATRVCKELSSVTR